MKMLTLLLLLLKATVFWASADTSMLVAEANVVDINYCTTDITTQATITLSIKVRNTSKEPIQLETVNRPTRLFVSRSLRDARSDKYEFKMGMEELDVATPLYTAASEKAGTPDEVIQVTVDLAIPLGENGLKNYEGQHFLRVKIPVMLKSNNGYHGVVLNTAPVALRFQLPSSVPRC